MSQVTGGHGVPPIILDPQRGGNMIDPMRMSKSPDVLSGFEKSPNGQLTRPSDQLAIISIFMWLEIRHVT